MPRKFSLDPDEFDVPSVNHFRQKWRNIPDSAARNVIAVECQYLAFHQYLLGSLRHRAVSGTLQIRIGLSVRAGALKTATLICASIAEAALRSHAEHRGYPLPAQPYKRTFGRVLAAWQLEGDVPRPEVTAVWTKIQELHQGRNSVHLYAAVHTSRTFYDVLDAEVHSLQDAEAVLEHLQAIISA